MTRSGIKCIIFSLESHLAFVAFSAYSWDITRQCDGSLLADPEKSLPKPVGKAEQVSSRPKKIELNKFLDKFDLVDFETGLNMSTVQENMFS